MVLAQENQASASFYPCSRWASPIHTVHLIKVPVLLCQVQGGAQEPAFLPDDRLGWPPSWSGLHLEGQPQKKLVAGWPAKSPLSQCLALSPVTFAPVASSGPHLSLWSCESESPVLRAVSGVANAGVSPSRSRISSLPAVSSFLIRGFRFWLLGVLLCDFCFRGL